MKEILKYTIVILVLVFSGDRSLYFLLNKLQSESQSGFLGKINTVLSSEEGYSGLILGSSRASRHVSPDILGGNFFNLGSDGMESSYHLGLMQILLEKGKIPQKVVLVVDESEILSNNYTNDINHLSAFYDVPYIKKEINNLGFSERFKFLFKTYRYNGKLPSLVKNSLFSSKTKIGNGYEPLKTNKNSLERVKKLLENNVPDFGHQVNQNTAQNYKELIELLKKNKVEVYVVSIPSLYKISELQKGVFDNFLSSLECKKINLSNQYIKDLAYWEDLVHLNENGANKISERIKVECKK